MNSWEATLSIPWDPWDPVSDEADVALANGVLVCECDASEAVREPSFSVAEAESIVPSRFT